LSSHTVSYLWDFGDGGTSTQANPVHTYGNPGNYTVLLAAANLNGCSDQEQHLVTTQVAGDITAPAAIIPFTATMGLAPRSVEIFWTAPGDDGAGGGSAAQYDIRYSENPIDDANWTSATPLLYPFSPKAPGSSERHAIASLTLGKRWYFAIKAVDEAGNWSAISNVPSVQEMGFRGSDDGYLLPNYGGVNYLDYSLDDMRRMFGDTAVCYMSGSLCTPKPEAAWWNLLVNQNMSGGHADGMASTSLRFFEDLDDPGNLKPGATSIQDLNLADSRRHIAYYHVEQYADPAALMRWQSAQGNPVGVLAALRSQIYSNLHDPALIFIHQGGMGHSLVPFGIEERPDGVVWVWVYDSNYPSNFSTSPGRILTIDPAANTWSYDLGWATWSGDANTHSLGIIPISVYAQQPLAPWVTAPSHAPGGGDSVQIWLTGAGHLLATDGQGRRVGYAGGQYLNEIPGASYNTSSGGLGLTLEPVYALPVTSTHTILLEGTSLTQTNTISVTQFGSGYAVGVHNVPAAAPGLESPTAAGSLFIPGDGSEVAYTAFSAQEVDLLLTREFAGQSLQCTIGGADAGPLEKVVLLLDEANQRMGYSADEAGNGEYDLEIEWISAQGTDRFYHADIPIAAGDRHYVAYTSAGGFLEITIGIDHDGNGTIDDSFVVMNQAWQVQLPMVLGPP
jgi:PKD repeat protein